jgi:IS5 family transposase
MTSVNVPRRTLAEDLSSILESDEVSRLIDELQATRWTGRPGYPIRSMVGMMFAKSLYALPTWTRTVALVGEHTTLAAVIEPDGEVPSVYACYRFTAKLREHAHLLDACIARVLRELKRRKPALGHDVAIDASDMPAYANGLSFKGIKHRRERTPDEYSDPDASWGHRSAVSTRAAGTFYGYKLHLAVCSQTDLPLAWQVVTAKGNESMWVTTLLDRLSDVGIRPETCAMDKGYDHRRVYGECDERGVLPIIPLRNSRDVKIGNHLRPLCEHGYWQFAGSDYSRKAAKWRCPTGDCQPASLWRKANRLHPLIPRETVRWKGLYRSRASVERAFGRLKHERGLAPLRVRGIERVQLHADLTVLAHLSTVLARSVGTVSGAACPPSPTSPPLSQSSNGPTNISTPSTSRPSPSMRAG